MISKAHRRFWKCYEQLPPHIQQPAREKFRLWKISPTHPSLQFEERRNGI